METIKQKLHHWGNRQIYVNSNQIFKTKHEWEEVPMCRGLRIQCGWSCGAGRNCRYDPRPGNFHQPKVWKKTKQKKIKQWMRAFEEVEYNSPIPKCGWVVHNDLKSIVWGGRKFAGGGTYQTRPQASPSRLTSTVRSHWRVCTLDVIGWECPFASVGLPPPDTWPQFNLEKKHQTNTNWGIFYTNTGQVLFKTRRVIESKEHLGSCHKQKDARKTWQLDVMWYPCCYAGTEKGHEGKTYVAIKYRL